MTEEDAVRGAFRYALTILVIILFLTLLAPAVAPAEEHDHGSLGAAGEFYATWRMPNGGQPRSFSCCNRGDCYATTIKEINGVWVGRHRETGKWAVIPDSKLEENSPDERESPDGQSHMCAGKTGNVYCAVRGDGM